MSADRHPRTTARRYLRMLGASLILVLVVSGQQPQTARAAHAGTERPVHAPEVRASEAGIAEIARIDGRHLPQGQPWSPDGRLLAVVHATGLALWDANQPGAAPRSILDADVLDVRWSPDGTWLCCRVRVMNGTRGGAVRFQFVPAAGGDAEYRIPNAAIGNWIWADDGKVYFWNGETGVRKEVAPPRSWLAARPQLPLTPRSELVLAVSGDRRRPRQRPLLFTPGTPPVEVLVDSLFTHQSVQLWCRIEPGVAALAPPPVSASAPPSASPSASAPAPAPAPNPSRWIVTVRDGRRSETVVVNEQGHRSSALQSKDEPALQHVSASVDGRLVTGERCAAADTARTCTRIWTGAVDPKTFAPQTLAPKTSAPQTLAPQNFVQMDWEGRNPKVAPNGDHVAFETNTGHAVRIFALDTARGSR